VDERTPPVPRSELNLQPATGRIPAVVDSPSADLAKPCRNELTNEPSVVVYYGNEAEVSPGSLIALRAMGVPMAEQPSKPPKPPVVRAKAVKACVLRYLPLCVFLLAACGPTASRGPVDAITFDTAKHLDDFAFLPLAMAGRTDGWSLLATLVEDWRRSPRIQAGSMALFESLEIASLY
jgi:hypothetical protein